MHIKKIYLRKFKRFSNLTIKNIPSNAKLIIMLGPNGCGKSSIFDAFQLWQDDRVFGVKNNHEDYYVKNEGNSDQKELAEVDINFYEDIKITPTDNNGKIIYLRTAYRNSPKVSIDKLAPQDTPNTVFTRKQMIDSEACINEDYQRLIYETMAKMYSPDNDTRTVKDVRDELIGTLRTSMLNIFNDLNFVCPGMPNREAEFYFQKGAVAQYSYSSLSGGEKATFELLLDLLLKMPYYQRGIFCIDEPEIHIHAKAQGKLLKELLRIIPQGSQLWIATHSFGMLKEAAEQAKNNPDEIAFLNFDGYDFDEVIELEPTSCNQIVWQKIMDISLGDYTELMPRAVVLCEGNMVDGKERQNFDARCYMNIFKNKYPDVLFCSVGNCDDVAKGMSKTYKIIQQILPKSEVIKVVDLDDNSAEEVEEYRKNGIKVLNRRNIESYILDDDVLCKLCTQNQQSDKIEEVLKIKQEEIQKIKDEGYPDNDLKRISGSLCQKVKKLLNIKNCGNKSDSIMRDTLSKLITEDMDVYKELESSIFPNI